jgi:hypothetical protein
MGDHWPWAARELDPLEPFFFFCRGQKDFIYREFSWRKEKRKTAYWRMQGDQETSDPPTGTF